MPTVSGATPAPSPPTKNLGRQHPFYSRWEEDERKQRASYLATRRHLAPFLVPHRYEGEKAGVDLRRSRLGYGIGLNRAYTQEILGHIRSANVERNWGSLQKTLGDLMNNDATGDGTSLDNFFGGPVLEWMATSVGGMVLIDTPQPINAPKTRAEEAAAKIRPTFSWVPMSSVLDVGRTRRGFRFVKLIEEVDERDPMDEDQNKLTQRTVLYMLDPATNKIRVVRKDYATQETTEQALDALVDLEGQPMLPLVYAGFGAHPDVPWLGTGLLQGLDDIVIDLFNLLTEIRENYRDVAFSLLTYTGGDHDKVREYLEAGSRFVPLGENEKANLERLHVDSGDVSAGLDLFKVGLENWQVSARRKSAEATQGVADGASGIALQAEFQLDLKPLLVALTQQLDQVQLNAMYLAAQMAGLPPKGAEQITVKRDTAFRLEDEAARISRIVREFKESLPLPAVLTERLVMRWAERSDLFNLDEPVTTMTEDGGETKRKLRDVLEEQAASLADAAQSEQINASAALTALARGAAAEPAPTDVQP